MTVEQLESRVVLDWRLSYLPDKVARSPVPLGFIELVGAINPIDLDRLYDQAAIVPYATLAKFNSAGDKLQILHDNADGNGVTDYPPLNDYRQSTHTVAALPGVTVNVGGSLVCQILDSADRVATNGELYNIVPRELAHLTDPDGSKGIKLLSILHTIPAVDANGATLGFGNDASTAWENVQLLIWQGVREPIAITDYVN